MLTSDEKCSSFFYLKKMKDVFEEGQGGISVLETRSHCIA